MAPSKQGSTHQMSAYYSIYRPRKDERLSWRSWSTYSGRFIHISDHPSAAGQAQDRKVRRGITDVLPLCYATEIACKCTDKKMNIKSNDRTMVAIINTSELTSPQLIEIPSRARSPVAPVRLRRSEPAKSTKLNFAVNTSTSFSAALPSTFHTDVVVMIIIIIIM